MALPRSIIPVQFAGGLDQKRPAKGALPGKFLVLENCIRRKFDLIEKRFGLTALSRDIFGSASDLSTGVHLDTFQDDVSLFDGAGLYSYSSAADAYVFKGNAVTTRVSSTSMVRNGNTQAMPDIASSNGLTVTVWEDSRGGVRYSVYDDVTGSALVYDVSIDAAAVQPKVVALRDAFLIGYIVGAALKVRTIAHTTPTTLSAAADVVGSGVDPTAYWDLDKVDATYAAFAVSTTVPDLTVGYVDQNGIVGDPITNTLPAVVPGVGTTAATDFCSIVGDLLNNKIWILYGGGTEVKAIAFSLDLITTSSVTIAGETGCNATGVVRAADGALAAFYEKAGATVKKNQIKSAILTWAIGGSLTVATAAATLIKSVGLASKAFEVGASQYFTVAHESALQPTYFTVRQDGVLLTRILGGIGGGLTRDASGTLKAGLPHVQFNSASEYVTALGVKNRLTIESGGTTLKSNQGLNKIGIAFAAAPVTRTLGQNMHISGGMLQMYDGVAACEHGFLVYPEDVTIAETGSAGSLIDATQYNFRVLYEWVDGRGQIHRSAPSITSTITTTAASRTITLTVPTLRLTNKTASSVKIVLYMAAAGLSTVYYRKSETSNTTAADTVDIAVTTAADPSQEVLYTTGGIVDNIAAPACSAVHVHKNRAWIGGLETDELWYSKEFVVGEGVAFSDFFRLAMESQGGSVTAFASLDSNLVVFKNTRMYYISGEGPVDTGAQNDYGRPQLIAGDVGTSIANSVVESPFGLFFKSEKGFYQLTRNYQVKYVGADVEDFNSLTVTGSVLLKDDNEVRFFTIEGTCLVYNYFFNQWSTFTGHAAVSACNGLSTTLHLQSDGTVQKEVADQYEDNGVRYSMAIETSWFAFAGVQGFQRIYELALLGDFVSHHFTRLKVAYDYEDAYNQTVYFDTRTGLVSTSVYGEGDFYGDPAIVYGGAGSSVYQFRFAPARQKCEAMKLRIEDVDTIGANGGGSVKFMTLAFEVGRKAGIYRLPGTKSIGAT